MNDRLSIVISVYNEEKNIRALMEELMSVIPIITSDYEVIFVDDGSTDSSFGIISSSMCENKRVKVIRFTRNFGQHAAMMAGFSCASGDIIVTMDADLQNDPRDISALLAKLEEGYDVVGGLRKDRKDPFFRRMASLLVNRLISRLTGVRLNDHGCMLRAYRKSVIEKLGRLKETPLYPVALISWLGVSVAEVPVNHRERHSGRSKYDFPKLVNTTYKLFIAFSSFPGLSVILAGLTIVLFSLIFGLYLAYDLIANGVRPGFIEMMAFILFLGQGLIFSVIGYLGDFIGRIYAETLGRPHYIIRDTLGFD